MKRIFSLLLFAVVAEGVYAQQVYTIKADSTKLTGCDSANELIIENHTRDVKGFLFNTGNGRTIFKKALTKLSDTAYLIGPDTLKYNAWVQRGNRFGTTGVLGTLDNNHLDIYTNNTPMVRFANTGRLLIGTTTDNNRESVQLNGSMYMNGYISNFLAPSGTASGALRLRWGTFDGSYISFYNQGSVKRRGWIASPADGRALIIEDSVGVSFKGTPIVSVGTENGFSNAKLTVANPLGSSLDVFNAGRYRPEDSVAAVELAVKANGNVIVGPGADAGWPNKFQINGTGKILFQPNLSRAGDQILIGGYINTTDGQNCLFRTAKAGGGWNYVLSERDGNLAVGIGGPAWSVGWSPLRITSTGIVSVISPTYFYGNIGGPGNSSALITTVSNTDEWNTGAAYPNGQNYYSIKTFLGGPGAGNTRAPLKIGANQLIFMSGATDIEYARLSESGNLGLGTASPSAQLHTTGTVRFAGLTNDSAQTRVLVSDANGNLYYRSASSLAMGDVVHSSLAVNGPIKAKSLILSQSGWPDYVFDSAYHLLPLQEVERYIQMNKHLPGVPAASTVEKDGLSVGDAQAVMLKKIEELTLYVVAQQKELDELRKEVYGRKRKSSINAITTKRHAK